jgi:hypothetical protein
MARKRYSEIERRLIHLRALAILRRLENFKPSSQSGRYSQAEARAIHDRAVAKLSGDKAAEARAIHSRALAQLERLKNFTPSTPRYSQAERRAINAKARLILERDANRRRLEKLVSKLRMRTVANGCTAQEAEAARATVERLQRILKDW